jgi:hypothetical protein
LLNVNMGRGREFGKERLETKGEIYMYHGKA